MKRSVPIIPLLVGLALAGLVILLSRGGYGSVSALKERRPGDDRVAGVGGSNAVMAFVGKVVKGPGTAPSGFEGVWPGFRGADLSNISRAGKPLARAWPAGGPPVLWKLEVGEGFAAAAIWKGRVYFTDYDHKGQSDALRCHSLADGAEIWRYTYPVRVKRNHGMSRTIPYVNGQVAISLGPKCHVVCVDAATGELRWKTDLVERYNVEVPPWYAGQCPFVDGNRLILGTGGDALCVALDLETGKEVWKSSNSNRWQMTHSSIIPVEFKGRKMYVYCASGGVAGVDAKDGRILWETPDWKISMANIPSPLDVGEGRIFLSGGYNAGSMMIQLKEEGDRLAVETVFRLKPNVFGATQHTPVLYQNHIIGVRPDGQLACLDLKGQSVWESGAANKYGLGPFMIAQDLLLAMNDDGLLTLAEASTASFKKLAQAQVLKGPDAWGPMALADGRLILRDMNQMLCLDVAAK
jgi:outer membrane protein assembly factor BamB